METAAASTAWQGLLFAGPHVKLHKPISPALTGGTWRPFVSKCCPFQVCSAFSPLQPKDLLGFCIANPSPRIFSLFPSTDSHYMLLWWPLAKCDALQPFIYGKKCILNHLYIACLVSLPFPASWKHHFLGAKLFFPYGLFSCPFHPIDSPELTFNEAVQSVKRTLLAHPVLRGFSSAISPRWWMGAPCLSCSGRIYQIHILLDVSSAK